MGRQFVELELFGKGIRTDFYAIRAKVEGEVKNAKLFCKSSLQRSECCNCIEFFGNLNRINDITAEEFGRVEKKFLRWNEKYKLLTESTRRGEKRTTVRLAVSHPNVR
jgi:hypothetical protein